MDFPATEYSAADGQQHNIVINAQANNYASNNSILYVTLVQYWNARLRLIVHHQHSIPGGIFPHLLLCIKD